LLANVSPLLDIAPMSVGYGYDPRRYHRDVASFGAS
jgi:hypothetical protein